MLKLQFGLPAETTESSWFLEGGLGIDPPWYADSFRKPFFFFFFQRPTFQTRCLNLGDFFLHQTSFPTLLNHHATFISLKATSTLVCKVYKTNTVNVVILLIRGRATTKAQGLMNLHSITAESDRLLSRRNELSFLYL